MTTRRTTTMTMASITTTNAAAAAATTTTTTTTQNNGPSSSKPYAYRDAQAGRCSPGPACAKQVGVWHICTHRHGAYATALLPELHHDLVHWHIHSPRDLPESVQRCVDLRAAGREFNPQPPCLRTLYVNHVSAHTNCLSPQATPSP
jgi:hypothetical protein